MLGLPKPAKNNNGVLMPSDVANGSKVQKGDKADPDTVAALVAHLNDDVEDASILRN